MNKWHSIVAFFFEARGFKVYGKDKKISANGYDLMISKGDKIFSVEIKKLRFSARSYRIDILPSQRKSDLLVLVTENETVIPLPMSLLSEKKSKGICLGGLLGDL